MKRLAVMAAAICLACAAQAQKPADPPAAAAAAAEPTPITFLDSSLFDNMLSKELGAGKESVEVTIAGKISLNNIPGRVDKWISAVAENGEVTVKPVSQELKPKFILALLPVVYSFLKQANADRVWEPARKYNAAVIYHVDRSGESVIDRIVFTKKK